MGMLVTLYLITANTYAAMEAPPNRGFSYAEVWMVGVQVPILVALIEYAYILSKLKAIKVRSSVASENGYNNCFRIPKKTMCFSG